MAQDLLTYGITINTFFIDQPGHRFDPTLYWNVSFMPLDRDLRLRISPGYPSSRRE